MHRTEPTTSSTWGYCAECDRWFPCPRWFDKDAPQPLCDRCYAEPSAIEHRNGDDGHDPSGVVVGKCPRCRQWFDCEDWCRDTAPVPRCPDCRLLPVRVERLRL